MSCARQGGVDPSLNHKLAGLLDKARDLQVPKANIENALQKAQGKGPDAPALTSVIYEGYGPKVRLLAAAAAAAVGWWWWWSWEEEL